MAKVRKAAGTGTKSPTARSGDLPLGATTADMLEEDSDTVGQARMQWQFGDWHTLIGLSHATVAATQERAGLAVLVASAHQHLGNRHDAERFLRSALSWGAERKSVARILASDVHNSLACSCILANDWSRAVGHFREAVKGVSGDERLACQARVVRELARLGLLSEAGRVLRTGIDGVGLVASDQLRTRFLEESLQPTQESNSRQGAHAVREVADDCMGHDDLHACVDALLHDDSWTNEEKFDLCIVVSDRLYEAKDNLSGLHFLRHAADYVSEVPVLSERQNARLSERLTRRRRAPDALDLIVRSGIERLVDDENQRKTILKSYGDIWKQFLQQGAHGQALLIDYIESNDAAGRSGESSGRQTIIEIGSTREDVPGQGSTVQLAQCAHDSDMHFITVDMDPHNTAAAASSVQAIDDEFEAVNAKGEDFLRAYDGRIDYVFLDAYDFDHGKHSELRQSRYRKFLGSEINDTDCHRMHLDCAQSLVDKLSEGGVICIDDTWQDESGAWTAKGTLAVPYLLEHGFRVVDARNRAVLLKRA